MAAFAIIDSAQRPHISDRLTASGVPWISLFEGTAEAALTDIAPLVVSYEDLSAAPRALSEVESLALKKPALNVIESSLSARALAAHFRQFHLVRVPEKGGKEMLLRWYDTRVLEPFMGVLDPLQKALFLGPIHRWDFWDRFGDFKHLPLPGSLSEGFPALPPLRLDEVQYTKLLDACEPDVVIAQLRRVIPDEMRQLSHGVLYPFVDRHVEQARAEGVRTTDEFVHYMLLALYTSGGFITHPAVAEWRSASTEERAASDFTDWVMNLPDDIWESGAPLWEA